MLEARSLTKYYDHTPAVRGVSFTVQRGEILGYLGPNGAGKSTTIKMLTGLIEPSEGQIFYEGRSVHDDFPAFQQRIGYVPEEAHLYPQLTGREYLQLVGRLRGMPRRELEPKMDEFLRLFGLWNDRHDALSSYSKGMRQKILLSAALLHNPDILILDEPFSGLDVTSAMMLRSLIRALAEQGKIILYSSHVLEVVEKVCSKVLILRKGEVLVYDSIDHLRDLMSQPSLEGVFAQVTEVEDSDELAGKILDVMQVETVRPESSGQMPTTAVRIYRAVTRTLPHEFQNVHGDALLETAEEAMEPIRQRNGFLGLFRFFADLAIRVPLEYFAEFRKDLRYAVRMLAQSPGFTAVALISLTLGACIATCALSEMNGMVLRDVPVVARPSELVALQMPVSYPDYKRYRDENHVFAATMAYLAPTPFSVAVSGPRERIWGHLVTPSYFATLGVHPALGNFLTDEQGDAPSVVASYRFWQSHLSSDPSVVGKTLRINGQTATLVGVAPADFTGPAPILYPADLWMPISAGTGAAPELAGNTLERRDRALFRVTARLKPGISMAQAEADLDAIARQIEQDSADPDRNRPGRRITLLDGGKLLQFRKQDKPFFTSFLVLIAGLMVLIPCTNIANMTLARANSRRREIAVRLALGASRARLIRQLVTESMTLAAIASTLGFFGSIWLMHAMSQQKMPWYPMPVGYDFQPDGRVLLFALGLMVFTGLAFGLAPALQATRTDILPGLKNGESMLVSRHRRLSLRNLLIVSQVAGTLTLLTILGFQSFGIQTTLGVQQGFDLKDLYLICLDPIRDGYSAEESAGVLQKVIERIKELPSITAATLTESVPVSMPGKPLRILRPDRGNSKTELTALKHIVGRDYFSTTGIPILRGRSFERQDETSDSGRIIVSQALAREFWPDADPLGRQIEIARTTVAAIPIAVLPWNVNDRVGALENGRRVFEIIGVARDVAEGLTVQKPRPTIYFPLTAADYRQPLLSGITLIARATPGVDAFTVITHEISKVDSRLTPFDARSMAEQVDRFMSPLRTASWTYGLIWMFGLILAAVGLAGVTAYSVTHRGHEIGIRMALGAAKKDVLGLVMKDGAILVAAGMSLGLAAAWGASRMLAAINSTAGQVTSTTTSDPLVVFGVPLMLAALALFACYLPARRSLRIDPAVALRQE